MDMDLSVRKKFDDVIAKVKEPQSELSLADLGMVSKIRYFEKDKTIIVYLSANEPRSECPACSVISGVVLAGIERDLIAELEVEFPGWAISVR
jgi:metal-sulfur cluster biosynthetic enzyme